MEYSQLISEHKVFNLPTIKDQVLHLMNYIVSPLYPIIQYKIINYGKNSSFPSLDD